MYQVELKKMKFHSHIGVHPEEKVVGQDLEVDLKVTLNIVPDLSDDLEHYISYAKFYGIIRDIVAESRDDLIETLAKKIIVQIKEKYAAEIAHIKVYVKKKTLPMDGILESANVILEE
ncbi:dihydroneopterin aldolase [Ligilactobacillus cholophilus]|uniref:dihydroneopterin aldolase n=1 Tax=Ligilactobacillus cholophilus TaxID=3050131 RepID=UPI0025AF3D3B|nr:dihydroneopterin aldolase [Ligilactobacillus cholophilus]